MLAQVIPARPVVGRPAAVEVVRAPARLNCAGFCMYCDQRWCRSLDCIRRHQGTWWAVCDICQGLGSDDVGDPCSCANGVYQVGPDWPGAVRPA